MKRMLIIAITLMAIFPFTTLAQTTDAKPVVIEVFERDECKHCQEFLAFTKELQKTRSDFQVQEYDVNTTEGKTFFDEITTKLSLVRGTPIIYLNSTVIEGFDLPETTGKQIIALIDSGIGKEIPTLAQYAQVTTPATPGDGTGTCPLTGCDPGNAPQYTVRVPFTNIIIDLSTLSLPALAITLGTIDGFNPCAMWVLVMFLTALIGIGDKKKMWQIAGTFILAEAIMYYLILTVWLYTWDFIGLNAIVTPIVGIIAIGAGLYFLKKYQEDKQECEVTDIHQKAKIHTRIHSIAAGPLTIASFFAILALALSVNVFEFACSIGIPQTYTKILDMNALSWLGRQGLNAIYIFGYMIDDIIVFALALYSSQQLGLTHKYTRYSHLIGGLLMVGLGFIMLLKPELLVF